MLFRQKVKQNKGALLLEILFAFALFGFVYAAIVGLYFGVDTVVESAKIETILIAKADALLEEARLKARLDFNTMVSTSTSDALSTNILEVQDIDDMTKDIKVRIESKIHPRLYSEITARIFDWRHALGSKTCEFTGDWSQPQTYGSLDLGSSTTATFLAAQGDYVYLTADSSIQSKHDFFVIDVRDAQNPTIIASIDTGPGLMTLAVAGDYAYLGNSSINSQLQIVDISNPASPTLVTSFKLPGIYTDGTTIAQSIYYSKGVVYLGTKKSQIAELHVIDVSNVFSPVELGTWEANTAINGLWVKGNFVYVASPDSEEVNVLDATNPGAIARINGYDAAGNSGNGKSLYLVETRMYLGRTVGNDELYILDTSSTTPAKISSFQTSVTINDLLADTGLLFLATSDSAKELQIVNVENKNAPWILSTVDLTAKALSLDCANNILYVALDSEEGLTIITP